MNDCKHCNAELFPDCECLTSNNNHSDSDLSLPFSQYATHTDFVSHIDKLMSNDLSLLHCNIRSLYKNMDKLEEIVTPCSKPPDIIALSETRIKETSIIATLPGYNFINENSQTQAGGVGAYIKNNLKYVQRRDLQFKMHGCENIWLEILGKRQKIIIGIVYRHPQYNIDEFSQSLSETITKIAKNNYVYYVLGDININLLNATNNSRIQQYIDTLCSLGCYPIINKPTRVVNEAESCIDHIYTNNLSTEITPYIMLHNISDHYPIYLTVSKARLKRDVKQRYFRDTSNVNIIAFDRDLHETLDSLPMQYSEWNVNEKFDFIVRSMKSLADTHMPVRKYTRREYKLKLKPWITHGIISFIKHRDYLFRVYKRSNLPTDFETYKQFRNRLTHVKDLAKRKYYEEQFAQNSRNSKRTWK